MPITSVTTELVHELTGPLETRFALLSLVPLIDDHAVPRGRLVTLLDLLCDDASELAAMVNGASGEAPHEPMAFPVSDDRSFTVCQRGLMGLTSAHVNGDGGGGESHAPEGEG